jgi:hypothetical protein
MYVTIRTINVQLTRMPDALGVVGHVVGQINEKHGGTLGYSVMVGGDPTAISVVGTWETLGQFDQARTSWMADQEIASAMRMGAEMSTGMSDVIGQIVKPPGEPGPYALVNTAKMQLTAVGDALAFAVEVSEFIEGKTGTASGVITAFTGNQSEMFWVGYADDLQKIGSDNESLQADPDYMAFFKRSESLFVQNTLEQSIWQLLG